MVTIGQLREIEILPENWDGEDGMAFGAEFIQELVDLVSTMPLQPDLGPTGRGSVQFEYGSRKKGNKYLGIEIFEKRSGRKLFYKAGLSIRYEKILWPALQKLQYSVADVQIPGILEKG